MSENLCRDSLLDLLSHNPHGLCVNVLYFTTTVLLLGLGSPSLWAFIETSTPTDEATFDVGGWNSFPSKITYRHSAGF